MMFTMLFVLGLLLFIFCLMVLVFSWDMGRDYIIKGNKGRRLNPFEKLYDGFVELMKD